MYKHLRLRFTGLPFPVTRFTREHHDVRVIAFNVAREADAPLPTENVYLVRAPGNLHDDVRKLFTGGFSEHDEIPAVEPNLLIFRGRYKLPKDETLRAFLGVLAGALGTVLAYDPVTIERGVLDVPMLTLPRGDSSLRLRALQHYARDHGIDFKVASERPVPTLPVERPRAEVLDLLEWQVLQALDGAGLYGEADAGESAAAQAVATLAEEFGLSAEEADALRQRAERKVVREYARVRSRNLGLSTVPSGDPD